MDNRQLYLEKANEVAKNIFEKEYFNGLGIPLPLIDCIPEDDPNYQSGQYYITVGDTWQIHLNFGLLPTNMLEFIEEVKVITRHEIEHYLTCPFDVLTHFRILKEIIRVFETDHSDIVLDINKLAPTIANQAADIIIDTHNYRRYPKETAASERAWIKKSSGTDLAKSPSHAKLMFLIKQALWKEDLEIYSNDENVLDSVEQLSRTFDEGGITNRRFFPNKTKLYADTFFNLLKLEAESSPKDNGKSRAGAQQSPTLIPSKDCQNGGSAFIFQSPDKIKSAIEQFADESDLSDFERIINLAGIKQLSETDKRKIWFEANTEEIEIPNFAYNGSQDEYLFPEVWKIGDPIVDIDLMLTYSTSPIIIPGVTTKKWSKHSSFKGGSKAKARDLLLVLDSSSSMGSLKDANSKLFNAVKSCFAVTKYFEKQNSEVALINFSTKPHITPWSKNYDRFKEGLLLEGGGNTIFPVNALDKLRRSKKENLVLIVITDGEIQNADMTFHILQEHLLFGNKLYMFLHDIKGTANKFIDLENFGAVVSKSFISDEIKDAVFNSVKS